MAPTNQQCCEERKANHFTTVDTIYETSSAHTTERNTCWRSPLTRATYCMRSSVNMFIFASLIQKGCVDVAKQQNPLATFYDRLTNLPMIISQSCSQPSMTWPPTQAWEQTWRWQDLKQTEQIWCNCLKLKTFARLWTSHHKCDVNLSFKNDCDEFKLISLSRKHHPTYPNIGRLLWYPKKTLEDQQVL